MQPNEYRVLIEELKLILKNRKMTYKDLGQSIGISEAGIKRIFAGRDGKVSTLSKICDAMGFSFIELVTASSINTKQVHFFTEVQDRFLAEHFDAYVFFNELIVRNKTVEKIQSDHGLTARETEKYLLSLEKVDLIRRTPAGRISSSLKPPIGIHTDGLLRKTLVKNFATGMMEKIFSAKTDAKIKSLQTREWLLSQLHLQKLQRDLIHLYSEYDQISARDQGVLPLDSLIPVSIQTGWLTKETPYQAIAKYRAR